MAAAANMGGGPEKSTGDMGIARRSFCFLRLLMTDATADNLFLPHHAAAGDGHRRTTTRWASGRDGGNNRT